MNQFCLYILYIYTLVHISKNVSVLNKRIVILGGVDTAGSLSSTMHEYDPEKDRWKVFGELPRPIKSEYNMSLIAKNDD